MRMNLPAAVSSGMEVLAASIFCVQHPLETHEEVFAGQVVLHSPFMSTQSTSSREVVRRWSPQLPSLAESRHWLSAGKAVVYKTVSMMLVVTLV